MKYLLMLANYNTWVNTHIFKLSAGLQEVDYRMDRGVFFGSIHRTLNHILVVDKLWLARLQNETVESIQSLDQVLYGDLDELTEARQECDEKLITYVARLSQDDLERTFPYTRMTGQQGEAKVAEALLTLFNHQTHHRGQVHAMLTQSGLSNADMPGIDIVDYLGSIQT